MMKSKLVNLKKKSKWLNLKLGSHGFEMTTYLCYQGIQRESDVTA